MADLSLPSWLNAGVVTGAFGAAAAISLAFHKPALSAFFSDPATAQTVTAFFGAGLSIVGGLLKGLKG